MSWSSAPVDRDVPVDARERGRDRADRLGDGQRVLEQAVAVGLVVALGRRRVAVAGPSARRRPRSASPRRCGFWIVPSSSRRSRSIWSTFARGPVVQVGHGRTRPSRASRRPDTVRCGAGERAGHEHDLARPAQARRRSRARMRRHGPGPVPEDQLELVAVDGSTLRTGGPGRRQFLLQIPELSSRAKIKWRCGRHRMERKQRSSQEERAGSAPRSSAGCSTTAGVWSCRGSSSDELERVLAARGARAGAGRPVRRRTRWRPWSRWRPARARPRCAAWSTWSADSRWVRVCTRRRSRSSSSSSG